ncbi:MAG: hypothetical protein K0Q79_269 [Flavipsychrobacter sp.]|jgi:class 3 adenylate cyclase/tetratricopeptide (TPR) repeat protein|nr:hypothetical protein [Flavipsychrobacter sp.]
MNIKQRLIAAGCAALLSVFIIPCAQAQPGGSKRIDSLKNELSRAKEDTNKVAILGALAMYYANGDPKEGLKYCEQAVALSEKLQWKQGMATAYNSLGANYKSLSDYPKAMDNYLRSLKINEELNNRVNIARNTANIGNVYREMKNYPKALEYFDRSLKENEALGRKFGITNNYSDMAIIYSEMNDNARALEYFGKALKISEEIDDKEGEAIIYGNIGNVYTDMHQYDKAIEHFVKSEKLNEELGRMVGLAINYTNLGKNYFLMAVDTNNRVSGKDALLDKAIVYFSKTTPILADMGAIDMLAENYGGLANAYLAKKDYKGAYEAYKEYRTLRDSVFSNDNKVKIANLTAERAETEKKQQEELTKLTQNKRRNEGILFGVVTVFLLVFAVFMVRERRRSDKLLLNILPEKVAAELKAKGTAAASNFDNVSVLFTDFVNFTTVAETMDPNALVHELHTCFMAFDGIISKYGIEKIKTVGDAYIAVAGLPVANAEHAVNTINAAMEIRAFTADRREKMGNKTFDIRIGINSGSVVAGIVGVKKFAYDIWGDTVNTAARMEQNSEAGEINISQSTYELVKDKFNCTYRGELEAKNKGALAMYFVVGKKG